MSYPRFYASSEVPLYWVALSPDDIRVIDNDIWYVSSSTESALLDDDRVFRMERVG